jgi:hypothetical protein
MGIEVWVHDVKGKSGYDVLTIWVSMPGVQYRQSAPGARQAAPDDEAINCKALFPAEGRLQYSSALAYLCIVL